MNDRDKLITALEDAITELIVRRDDPNTSEQEAAKLTAKIAELEARLAELRAQDLAEAANDAALEGPSAAEFTKMRKLADRLDAAVASGKKTSAILNLVQKAVNVLTT